MMISRLCGKKGIAMPVVLALGSILAIGSTFLLQSITKQLPAAVKNKDETLVIASAHTVAALLKQELKNNYDDFIGNVGQWSTCTGSHANVDDFLNVLMDPVSFSCENAPFSLDHFSNGSSNRHVILSNLTSTDLVLPNVINKFTTTIRINRFQFNSERRQVIGNINFVAASSSIRRNLRFFVDMNRIAQTPQRQPACHVCHAIPGSVCCNGSGIVQLSYLERGRGRVMDASFDRNVSTTIIQPNPAYTPVPRAIAIKGSPPTPHVYYNNSFCVASISTDPILYIIDSAVQRSTDYFLTTHGEIMTGASTLVAFDPKLQSIAYTGGGWLLLRGDGQVMETQTLNDPASYLPITGLKLSLASSLVVGEGATPCP